MNIEMYVKCTLFHLHKEGSISIFIIHVSIDDGEGNGNPLQYSCLENPMDLGAW